MSVLKNKRNLSGLEFFHNAYEVRSDLTKLLLRDFGVKNKIRNELAITKYMDPEDAAAFDGLVKKYNGLYIYDEYPEWLIDKLRTNILNLSHALVMNITQANSIYPAYESEYFERRNFQNRAIGNCEQLLQEMQFILSVLPVDVNKYAFYVDKVEREIALLKGWRKGDNRILKRIREKPEKDSASDS